MTKHGRNTPSIPYACLLLLSLALTHCQVEPQAGQASETTGKSQPVELQNDSCRLAIDLYGGAFYEFVSLENSVNPLSWSLTAEQMPENNQDGAPFKGHFLCLGRWGSPSAGEIAAGIPHNGEPTNTMWELAEKTSQKLVMKNDAPLDGLSIQRSVSLNEAEPAFLATEQITNDSPLGRPGNVVQHVTLGPPFLTPEVTVQTNAGRGFNQKMALPDPHAYAFEWPQGIMDTSGTTVDLRRTDVSANYVTTHIFPEEASYGWITAYNPREGLLIGYVWPLADYPWVNIWNHQEDGKPVAKGLEFGTTGIGAPYETLLATDTRFHSHNSFEYIDAGETIEKSFMGFILNVGSGASILPVETNEAQIVVKASYEGARSAEWTLTNRMKKK